MAFRYASRQPQARGGGYEHYAPKPPWQIEPLEARNAAPASPFMCSVGYPACATGGPVSARRGVQFLRRAEAIP